MPLASPAQRWTHPLPRGQFYLLPWRCAHPTARRFCFIPCIKNLSPHYQPPRSRTSWERLTKVKTKTSQEVQMEATAKSLFLLPPLPQPPESTLWRAARFPQQEAWRSIPPHLKKVRCGTRSSCANSTSCLMIRSRKPRPSTSTPPPPLHLPPAHYR